MTLAEYKAALDRLDDSEFARFRASFGGDFVTRQQYLDDFVGHPQYERRICQLLDLATQDERLADAAILSARAALESAKSARWAMIWAALGVIVSLAALALASR
jgi:hypothetical protein